MIPVDQTEFSSADTEPQQYGNCLSACLASLTGIPLSDIPNFASLYAKTGYWSEAFTKFLLGHGYQFIEYFYFPQNWNWNDLLKQSNGIDGYFICGGVSPRNTFVGHAVIYKDGVMAHDPHPSREGLIVLEDAYIIERLKEIRWRI